MSIVRDRFSLSARQVVGLAQEEAARYQQSHIAPAHLLLGLMQAKGEAQGVLLEEGLTVEHVRTVIEQLTVDLGPSLDPPLHLTPETEQVMKTAFEEAVQRQNRLIRSGHLLLGILALADTSLLEALEMNPEHIREQVEQALQFPVTKVASEEERATRPPWWKFWK
jgi:ATP-dependent Clp protease ATP-binding subunit ClpC